MAEIRTVTVFKTTKGRILKQIRGINPSYKPSDVITFEKDTYHVKGFKTDNRPILPKKDGSGSVQVIENNVTLIKDSDMDQKSIDALKRHIGTPRIFSLEDIEKKALTQEAKKAQNGSKISIKPSDLTQASVNSRPSPNEAMQGETKDLAPKNESVVVNPETESSEKEEVKGKGKRNRNGNSKKTETNKQETVEV